MKSLPVDDRLTIANMTTEWGALMANFPIDSTLQGWMRATATTSALFDEKDAVRRFTHHQIDDLLETQLVANKGATYAKPPYQPFDFIPLRIRAQFRQALLGTGAKPLISGCGPCIGLGTGLLEPGEVGISASNRNFKGRMGSLDTKAYLASPEVVAASTSSGKISGQGWYKKPVRVEKVVLGEGNGIPEENRAISVGDALDRLIADADKIIDSSETSTFGSLHPSLQQPRMKSTSN
ncbi:uncharacterized protein BP5553_07358 [Venustampulla echinocandica]|uniref:Aconitase/3-isopropylmalate dehydratase large subunit alpha/beta/alpha domain-containing protein n=1 Tax=Venustampulla echinocandica TaxID=2656787 RepID=A0A370TJ97_9HELO|nr:uncharacterized protein BP5553_07358 [Venustampulla echinocandica]RDL35427.1 hypothetical protein BP5553_07358 [Venustampulla echinocandica]